MAGQSAQERSTIIFHRPTSIQKNHNAIETPEIDLTCLHLHKEINDSRSIILKNKEILTQDLDILSVVEDYQTLFYNPPEKGSYSRGSPLTSNKVCESRYPENTEGCN